ncbi:MAG: methyltransferase [Candidatus Thorarchaeota archaeon]
MKEIHKISPIAQLLTFIAGKTYTHVISVAAKLGIADLLADGPKSIEELSKATETHTPSLYRVLRVLDRMGIFSEEPTGFFSLTETSEFLRANSPFSVKDWAILNGTEWHSRSWMRLLYSVKTGRPSFWDIYEMKGFEYFQKNPEDYRNLNNAMTFFSKGQARRLVNSYDFSNFKNIVDVGGGNGYLLTSILKNNPSLRGILFDLPEVTNGARKIIAKENLGDRCRIVGGNFFHEVPKGADAYIMKYVIHDWSNDNARLILHNCREAIAPEGRILVIDKVISLKSGLNDEIMGDIEMMILGEGRERTESEFRELFESTGFKLNKIIPTQLPLFILEGKCN